MICKDCIEYKDKIAQLEMKYKKLKEENEELRKTIGEQDAKITQLQLIIEKLQKENEELTLTLKSSLRRFPKREPNKRNPKERGRQPGFKGTSRNKPKKIDESIELQLPHCTHCGSTELVSKGRRERVVEEITKPTLKVKRYVINIYKCRKCNQRVEAKPVDALPNSRFGLRFALLVTLLKSKGIPYNKIKTIIETVYDTTLTEKTLYDVVKKLAKYFEPAYKELVEEVKKSEVVGVDDTGWNNNGDAGWLWAFTTIDTIVYKIAESRGHEVIESVIGGEYGGVLIRDGHSSFNSLHCKKQSCWVHINRNIRDVMKRKKPPPSKKFVELAEEIKRIFEKARRVHGQDREKQLNVKRELEERVERLWLKYSNETLDEDSRKTIKFLIKHRQELFTFLEHEGVKWHNNDTERAIRPNVVIRKNSYCNRSERGIRAHEVIMSITQTCKLREQNFMKWGEEYTYQLLSQQAQKGK